MEPKWFAKLKMKIATKVGNLSSTPPILEDYVSFLSSGIVNDYII
jgi:hypothetical protein